MGLACAELHGDHGVELRLGVGVAAIEGTRRVEQVRLTDGSVVPADVVVVGIGVAPATGWLEGSGLELRDGVVCDATLAAGPPGVYAAGDVCRWPNPLFDEEMRVEHWTNAAEQGAHAARSLLAAAAGQPAAPYAPVPFFWSDQYGQRIQFLGRAGPRRRGRGSSAGPWRTGLRRPLRAGRSPPGRARPLPPQAGHAATRSSSPPARPGTTPWPTPRPPAEAGADAIDGRRP